MRKVVLFIAVSLDGYLADPAGGVDWLQGHGPAEETRDTYADFIQGVDTVIMGWNTYHQIVTELSPEQWVYAGLHTYVVTHRTLPSTAEICFTGEDPCALVDALRRQPGGDIWICGGAELVRQLMDGGYIDEYYLSVIPTILGGGIRLFGPTAAPLPLTLVQAETNNGITELRYVPRK